MEEDKAEEGADDGDAQSADENGTDNQMEGEVQSFTDTSFASLESKVSEQTLKGVADMGFTHMTEIQYKSIPFLLEGRWGIKDQTTKLLITE